MFAMLRSSEERIELATTYCMGAESDIDRPQNGIRASAEGAVWCSDMNQ